MADEDVVVNDNYRDESLPRHHQLTPIEGFAAEDLEPAVDHVVVTNMDDSLAAAPRAGGRSPPNYDKAPDFAEPGGQTSKGSRTSLQLPTPTSTTLDEGDELTAGFTQQQPRPKVGIVNRLPSQQPEMQELAHDMVAQTVSRKATRKGEPRLMQQVTAAMNQHHRMDEQSLARVVTTRMRRQSSMPTRRTSEQPVESNALYEDLERIKDIKKNPRRMSHKLSELRDERSHLQTDLEQITGFTLWWAEASMRLRHAKENVIDFFKNIQIWKHSIKKLEGRHGQAVGTYFRYLRWNFNMNVFMGLLYILLVTVPYGLQNGFTTAERLIQPQYNASSDGYAEEFAALLTGGGGLNLSAYFIGSYMVEYDGFDNSKSVGNYDVPLAYAFVTIISLICIVAALFRSVYINIYNVASFMDEGQTPLSQTLFASHDYSLTERTSILIQQEGFARVLMGQVFELQAREADKEKDKRWILFKRVVINLIVLGILAASFYGIEAAVSRFSTSDDDLELLIPSFVVSILNQAVPISFEIMARKEEWRTPLHGIQATIMRSIVLRIGSLYAFFYTYFIQRSNRMCWESFVGQQIYAFLIVSFLVEIVTSMVIDPVRKALFERTTWFKNYLPTARFQTIKCTLEMLWTQAICWFGTFFCPLLPILAAIKHGVLFYLKKFSTLRFCAPPEVAFRATYSLGSVVSFMMLFTLFCIAIPLGYTLTSVQPSGAFVSDAHRWIDPGVLTGAVCTDDSASCSDCYGSSPNFTQSVCFRTGASGSYPIGVTVTLEDLCNACPTGCGPFRHQKSVFNVLDNEYRTWPTALRAIFDYIGTIAFATVFVFGLLTWLLISSAKLSAQRRLIARLQMERDMERMDKRWILKEWAITFEGHEDMKRK
eukprot:m.115252 g.115252  ORF g.115252 m.115252 type:complete len:881 (-) comp15486_c0_seq1:97-2739(-)